MAINVGNDYRVFLAGLRDDLTGAWITDALFTFTAYANWNEAAGSGVQIAGAVNLPMLFVAGSNGDYAGLLPASVTAQLTPGENPVGITAIASNYGVVRRVVDQVAY